MPSTVPSRRMTYKEIQSYARHNSQHEAANVDLPNFNQSRSTHGADNKARHLSVASLPSLSPNQAPLRRPHVTPSAVPQRQARKAPLVVLANRALRTVLVACCGLAIVGYGFDVASSNDVGKLQEQAKRLNEQNSELSAQLLKAISFEGIQASALGRAGLRVPEQVLIVPEKAAPPVPQFHANKHHFPIMAGY